MFGSITADLLIYAAMGVTLSTGSLVAYRSYKTSILDEIIGDKQLVLMLRKRGLLNDFVQGGLHCSVCGDTLHRANLRLVISRHPELQFTCGKLRCTSQFIAEQARGPDIGVAS
jgi:hypothetical protein